MNSHLLPVNHGRVLGDEFPSGLVAAVLVGASNWLGILELLLEVLHILVALHALKVTHDELGLGIGGSSDSSINRHESAQGKSSQVSDFGHLGQIVNSNLVVALLDGIHVVLTVLHESSESSSQVRLVLVEILHDSLHEMLILMLEPSKMGKINIHGHFFLFAHSLRGSDIVLDWLTILFRQTICILVIVGVLRVELEAKKLSLFISILTWPRTGKNRSLYFCLVG